jgi:hypothetical protein
LALNAFKSLLPIFPTPMHPMAIRSDGALAPNTDDGTMAGTANAAPAAKADERRRLLRLMALLLSLLLELTT